VIVQNTGLLESGDSLRGTALRMGAPVPFVVTGRGYANMRRTGVGPDDERTIESLTRADVDSAALLTEPTLDAWGIPYEVCGEDDDSAEMIGALVEEARSRSAPVCLILACALD
jgi:hypothetical protein